MGFDLQGYADPPAPGAVRWCSTNPAKVFGLKSPMGTPYPDPTLIVVYDAHANARQGERAVYTIPAHRLDYWCEGMLWVRAPGAGWMGTRTPEGGLTLITRERLRQITEEGWTPEHDDEHGGASLAQAASVYAMPLHLRRNIPMQDRGAYRLVPADWPWEPVAYKPTPDNRIRELVKAGALIVAEIDRLRRLGDVADPPRA